MNEPYLNITPLGGLGEIGLNCQLWETSGGVVMVDCGLMFPDDAHLGVDVVIPHFGAVSGIKDKLLGIVLTHGHEDHIGALPWIVPEIKGTRIYGSRFTLALVEHKLREREILDWVELCPVDINTVLPLGDLTFHFFPVCHSIPEGFGLGVETPVGRVVHSGDFKIDPHPLDATGTDLNLFRNFAGPDGARLLLSDSTNIVREGRSLTEREVKDSLDKIFAKAEGRIVITLFSSHIQRIQEVFDLAREHGRTVVISGKSLANNIEMARDLGIAKLPPSFFNAHNGVPDLPDDQIVLVVTGAQGEPLSALSRMVLGGHRQLEIRKGDTVVMSSRMIPGNAKAISRLINEMYRIGAEVLYESVHAIHASGHGQREELRDMLEAVRPTLFVPVHGEYQHLVKHGRLAVECGVEQDNVILLEDGLPLTLLKDSFRLEQRVPVECTLVDGKGVGDVGYAVLKERRILGDEGMVIVVLVVDSETGSILHGPEMISKGFVFEQHYSHLLEDAKCLVLDEIEAARPGQLGRLQEGIRSSLRRFFRRVLERDPVVVPVISEV
ncbi:ribonuclease J [Desulfovibrio desulfuricans]|uniref:Ribonuclease J n=2 Tax=root TaxID=1 RepID=A0A212KDD4_9BACT|nr:ribonuclease J [Desulfovibrio desulfuricans]MBT9749274.1 RNase J family beta-CASP ribonuclease [Desulfovibrio desulfuricans]MCB6541513.1 ribonuclease J [Desulfovibrio desulfuricans]MCB6552594.1 ribonuclease J [Desulfovibrio desulfuricans]MCB6564479.1 ribonuclease J [Desulfovibrio desulfuricans]MCB7345619.1 ribonuclease J [Desulfovibrio desulfuricans]